MITQAMLESTLRPGEKGVLTLEEAKQRLAAGNLNVMTLSTVGFEHEYYCFTDNYCFGGNLLPYHIVPACTTLPIMVAPREGVEEGIVDTIEKLMRVFNYDEKLVETMEDWVKVVNLPLPESTPPIHHSKPEKRRFQPEHFPRGTVCTIEVMGSPPRSFTVHSIASNGWDSYVLCSGYTSELGIPDNFNMDWVTSIQKHGTQGMHWDPPTYQGTIFASIPLKRAKSRYVAYRLTDLVSHLFRAEKVTTQEHDHEALRDAICRLPFIRRHTSTLLFKHHRFESMFYSVSKKKLNKWFKQNRNRFLLSRKAIQERKEDYEREMDEMYGDTSYPEP